MSGDTLAKGARSCMFGPPKVSAERWAEIWADDGGKEYEIVYTVPHHVGGCVSVPDSTKVIIDKAE
jgi:hypothetical protein